MNITSSQTETHTMEITPPMHVTYRKTGNQTDTHLLISEIEISRTNGTRYETTSYRIAYRGETAKADGTPGQGRYVRDEIHTRNEYPANYVAAVNTLAEHFGFPNFYVMTDNY
jgi:hypothetical protein